MFEKKGDWSEYTIREDQRGWIVEGNSRIQGCRTNYKWLIPFEKSMYVAGANLNEMHNNYMTKGEYIFEAEREDRRILRSGHIVE